MELFINGALMAPLLNTLTGAALMARPVWTASARSSAAARLTIENEILALVTFPSVGLFIC